MCVGFAWVDSRTMVVDGVLPSNGFISSVEIGIFYCFYNFLLTDLIGK